MQEEVMKEIVEGTLSILLDKGQAGLDKLITQRREKGRLKDYQQAAKARSNSRLIEIIKTLYNRYPLLERGGTSYPVTAIPCPRAQENDVDSILGVLKRQSKDDFLPDPSYLRLLKQQGKSIWNDITYVLESFVDKRSLKVNCSLGWYYDALTTCDSLEWELLRTLRNKPQRSKSILRKLKQRTRIRKINRDPLHDGSARSAALSISTLIVYNDGKTYRALLRQRSGRTAAHSDLYHVVPSGMFEPCFGYIDQEYSVSLTIWREYLEEIFGKKEMNRSTGQLDLSIITKDERIVWLRKLIRDRKAQLLLTGFAINLLNLRPEICTVLLIHDKRWLRQRIVANWEFQPKPFPLDICRTDLEIAADLNLIPWTFVPPGAAAFWLGVDCVRRHIRK